MSRSMHAVVHIVHAYSTWQLPKTADLWKAIVDRKHLFDGTDTHDSVTYSYTCMGGGGRVGSVVTRRAIDLKVRGSSPAHGGSRIAG